MLLRQLRVLDVVQLKSCRFGIHARGRALASSNGDESNLTAVGFEPTQLALVELDSTPLDHSGKLS